MFLVKPLEEGSQGGKSLMRDTSKEVAAAQERAIASSCFVKPTEREEREANGWAIPQPDCCCQCASRYACVRMLVAGN